MKKPPKERYKIMNKKITKGQLAFCVAAFITASSLLTKSLYIFTRNESWLPVITAYPVALLIIWMYEKLSKRYPGQTIIEINDEVYGKIGGKIVSFLYIFYFFSLAFFNMRDLGDFIKGMILQNTPMVLIYGLFVIICVWAVRKGAVSMTRYGALLAIAAIAAIVINALFLINNMHLNSLLPVFRLSIKDYLIGTHIVTMFSYCESIVFVMFIPFLHNGGDFGGAMRRGLTAGALVLALIVFRDITVLRDLINVLALPTYAVIRLIDVGDILTRLEIIYAVMLISLFFFKVSILYFATVSGLGRIMKFKSWDFLIKIFGVFIIIYAFACFDSEAAHIKWNISVATTYSSFFILVLPLITLIVSKLRDVFSHTPELRSDEN